MEITLFLFGMNQNQNIQNIEILQEEEFFNNLSKSITDIKQVFNSNLMEVNNKSITIAIQQNQQEQDIIRLNTIIQNNSQDFNNSINNLTINSINSNTQIQNIILENQNLRRDLQNAQNELANARQQLINTNNNLQNIQNNLIQSNIKIELLERQRDESAIFQQRAINIYNESLQRNTHIDALILQQQQRNAEFQREIGELQDNKCNKVCQIF